MERPTLRKLKFLFFSQRDIRGKLFTTDWDSNPRSWDSKPARTRGYLLSGANAAQVLDVSSQKEFRERQRDG